MKYSIVSYLDKVATQKILQLQKELSHVTGSIASLTHWEPHITVGDGVDLSSDDLRIFRSQLEEDLIKIKPFKVILDGFIFNDNRTMGVDEKSTPYLIAVDVQQNDSLAELVKTIELMTSNMTRWYNQPIPYKPHVTLAFRDLTEEGYKLGINYIHNKKIHLDSLVDHVSLVEKLADKDVEIVRIPLKDLVRFPRP